VNLEELRKELDDLGIPHDQWAPSGGQTVQPKMIERYKGLLVKIRELLAEQIENDKNTVSELHATAERMKHGGGI